jgi:putative transposase
MGAASPRLSAVGRGDPAAQPRRWWSLCPVSPASWWVGYRSANKTVFSAKYHFVWCPKYRRKVLLGPVAERLKEIIAEVAGEAGDEVIEVEVMPDHVQLLVEVPPAVALSRFAQLPKGRSSRRLGREFPQLRRLPCLWSPSWLVSTVAGAPLHVVRRYVENHKRAA